MRARLLFGAVALGATVLVGGAATAQAAPTPSRISTAATLVPGYWKYMGTYSQSACHELRDSYAGDAYCSFRSTGRYAPYVYVP